jgi:VanZ family protein
MAAIFTVSSFRFGGGGAGIPDWLSHGTVYLILCLLVCRAVAGGFPEPLSPSAAVLAVLLSSAYGVSDEWHQSFVPGRNPSAADVAKDFAGSALGALLYRRAAPRKEVA